MARYRVLEKSFVNNTLHEEGAEIEYDGKAGPNLEPLDKPKRSKAKDDAEAPADEAPEEGAAAESEQLA